MSGFYELTGHAPENHLLPFLWIHGEDEATYRKMVNVIHDANIGAFCVEARPHPEFCRDGWWKDLGILLDEAEKLGMKVWLLDDKHFPTGYAAGAVEAAPLSLHRRHIAHKSVPVEEGQTVRLVMADEVKLQETLSPMAYGMLMYGNDGKLPEPLDLDELLSVSAFGTNGIIDLSENITDGILEWEVPAGVTSIEICSLTYDSGFHRNYINMIDPASCRLQIEAVYEPHYEHFGDKFGTVIAGFFSDEPELGNGVYINHYNVLGTDQTLPYSEPLAEKLAETLGENWAVQLPLLWLNHQDPAQTARVRYLYMDAVTRLVQSSFSEQIGNWCRSHGVDYIGHIIEDNNQHARTSTSLGHYFRGLRGQSMSGIDDIGGQVMPGGEDRMRQHIFGYMDDGEFYQYALGKLGSSGAAITPHMQGRTMCEIFGNYGWGEGVHLEKYLVDHFLVRGVNYFVPHAFTCSDYPDPDCPPHFYAQGNHPQYRHFGALMAYTNRLCALLSGGRAVLPAAVLYHGEAEWSGRAMMMQKPARILMDHQIDFVYLPSDVFAEPDFYHTELADEFSVNGNVFDLLVVPYMQFIPREAAEAIARMPQKVIFIDALPDGLCTGELLPEALRGCRVMTLEELTAFADGQLSRMSGGLRTVLPVPASDRLRVRHYIGEREIYLLVNEGPRPYEGSVEVPDIGPYCVYDPWSDKVYEAERTGARSFAVSLPPSGSLVLVKGTSSAAPARPVRPVGERTMLTHFTCSTCRAIDYPAFGNAQEIDVLQNYALTDPSFSGLLRYETTFDGAAYAGAPLLLEITDAHEGVEVFINGTSLGLGVLPPFLYELTPFITKGTNHLAIEVATVLDRERGDENGKPTGITGAVYLMRGEA